ncbi:hypothetical protein Agabi119p4_5557 [Agaricus bisporus var. burnettii]|uniref:Nucleoporin Nup159/Nup146 N-terminal domain-containing protein n=1 Tax=Agaricus bisporus var. burnettii TaxID=192524 RepID=A0A8H7F245_AGABI|nr:hypothetical protein Agabi119p4_5557 [Agaricus bisporus var. burnettii]
MQFTPLSHAGPSITPPERFPPISYPPQSNVNVNPNRRSCSSDGFNYPNFRLINKSTRVYLSEPFTLDSLTTYRPFAVANTKGWFAAVRKIGDAQDIIFSPLKDLRESIQKANEDEKGFFFPQRDLNLDVGLPTIVVFAQNDTRLLVGSDNGSIHVYDTAMLFSSGEGFVAPLHTYNAQYGALRQIAPNPGTEPDLVDKFAVVRSDGVVQLMNTNLESLGGWSSANSDGNPIAVSWSPKGKHLAIGLRSGDILTFAPNKLSVPNKHLPAAVEGQLVGLNWLSPGHTFRVTYAPQIANQGESIQQIVYLDTKSNGLTAFDTIHPFPMSDRQQESHALILPHWDEDSISENSKALMVVGDRASSDIEILGGHSGQWFQQSQENPVSLPLDKQSEETTLMVLDLDLTDSETSAPIVYAYLNDGSVQAWRLEHSKPYLKMMSLTTGTVPDIQVTQPGDITVDATMDEKDAANVLTSLSGFVTSDSNMPQQNSTFGTSAQPPSLFGQASQPTFGQTPSFGSPSTSSSIFGQSPAFGSSQPTSSFFGHQPSRHAFSDIATQRDTGNVFGGPSFGATSSSMPPPTQLAPDEMTREASMSDGTAPGFGTLSLGGGGSEVSDSKPKTGIFGSFGPAPSTSQPATPAFGGPIRPAQGFGAFSNYSSTTPTSGSSQEKSSSSAFSSTPQPAAHPAFGQTGFAKPSFGQPSFGQTGFGKPAPVTTAPASGNAFAAFASSPASFSSALQSNKGESSTVGGFAAYASGGSNTSRAASQSGQLGANAPTESAVQPLGSTGAFGSTSTSPSLAGSASGFGLRANAEATAVPRISPTQPPPGMMSPPSSPEPSIPSRPVSSPVEIKKEIPAPVSGPSSSSFIRESTAFGGLKAIEETSPFFKKHDEKMPVNAFRDFAQSKPAPSTVSPAFGAPSQLGATNRSVFGSTSQMGVAKPALVSTTPTTTPAKPAIAGGFSAFSGPSSGFFGVSGGQKKPFSELLKSEGDIEKGVDEGKHFSAKSSEGSTMEPSTPSKPTPVFSAASTPTSTKPSPSDITTTPKTPLTITEREENTTPKTPTSLPVTKREESATPQTPTPSIGAKQEESTTPKTPPRSSILKEEESTTPKVPVPSAIKSEESTTPKATPHEASRDASTSDLSVSSIGSFVDVSTDRSFDVVEEDEGDDAHSFLSSDFSSEPSTDDEESEEEEEVDRKKDKLSEVSDRRSSSPTPQPEVPSVFVSPSPPTDANQTSATQGESTTPPGSPSTGSQVPAKSPSPTPASTTPSSTSPSPSPFGIGIGRPSTRPARSSPLAAKPVSGEEEEEEGEIKAKPGIYEVPLSRLSVSPKPSIVREEPIKQKDNDATVRPITPPLLSAFGGPVSEKEKSTTHTKSEAEAVQIPSPIPAPARPPMPVFPTPIEPAAQAKDETSKPPLLPEGSQAPEAASVAPPTTSVPFSLPPFSLAPKPMAPPSQPPPSDSAPAMAKPPVFPRTEPPAPSEPPAGFKPSGFFGPQPAGVWGLDSHQSSPKPPQSAPATTSNKPATLSPPQSASKPTPMTIERACFSMVEGIEKELAELKELRDEVSIRYGRLTHAAGGSRLKAELGDRSKWGIADAVTFRQTVLQLEDDLVELSSIRETFKQALRELNGNMLRANTRREEIARFKKAKRDKEFAKMLNTRSLGPEHLESQQHLRRGIRAARDRIQKLESHLQESKRKLSQAASGRPYIKAPSLDVINRTYRNIDMAIQQQNDEMEKLAGRVSKLKIGSQNSPSGSRDIRLPDRQRRGIAISPHVAVTTAAALNAERSAYKLKKALLKVRKEPILNVRAASAPRPPSAFETPQKSPAASNIFESVQGPLFPPPEENRGTFWDIDLNVPAEDKFRPGAPLPSSKRGAGSNPKKHSSVSLKRTSSEASPPNKTSAADFWGTPPAFPSSKLAGEVKAKVPFVPLTPPTPITPTPTNRSKSPNSLPGGGFEAFLK